MKQIKPSHYVLNDGSEVIDVILNSMCTDEYCGFLMGNVIKYILRHDKKGKQEDLIKARYYLDELINCKYGEEEQQ